MKKIILYIILGSSLISNSYFIYENNQLKEQVKYLQQENEKLKETPEIYWQNAIEKFNNKNYTETKEILNKLIEKFPTSSLVKTSQEKINEINLIEKKKKEEEQRIIKSLSKQIANTKNALTAEKLLNDLDNKYDDTYSKLKAVISAKRNELSEKIEKERKRKEEQLQKEKEMQNKLKELGIEISNIRTYWTVSGDGLAMRSLVVPYFRMRIKNIGDKPITKLIVKGSFKLIDEREIFGDGISYVIGYGDAPIVSNYSKEVFFGCSTGYTNLYYSFPNMDMDLYININGGEDIFITTVKIKKVFQD